MAVQHPPSFRMSDGLWFTDSNTRCWLRTIARSAGSATIPDLLALLMLHKGYGFFSEDVNLILPHLENFGRTDFRALTARIALVRVDGDIPIARAVLKTIIGYHNLPPLNRIGRRFCSYNYQWRQGSRVQGVQVSSEYFSLSLLKATHSLIRRIPSTKLLPALFALCHFTRILDPLNPFGPLGFSFTLRFAHFQEGLSEQGCSNATGELRVKGITASDIPFFIPNTFGSFNA